MTTHIVSTVLIIYIAAVGMIGGIDTDAHDGALLVSIPGPTFQVNGAIVGEQNAHEYGHYLQQQQLGDIAYYATVAVPSLVANVVLVPYAIAVDNATVANRIYYALPWEAEATAIGEQAWH